MTVIHFCICELNGNYKPRFSPRCLFNNGVGSAGEVATTISWSFITQCYSLGLSSDGPGQCQLPPTSQLCDLELYHWTSLKFSFCFCETGRISPAPQIGIFFFFLAVPAGSLLQLAGFSSVACGPCCPMACEILVHRPGIEPISPA